MRASTIFALIIAVLVSLGAVIAVKASGVLTPAEPRKEAPRPVVLVSAANIFEGSFVQPAEVKLRPMHASEEIEWKAGKFMPAVTAAAVKRIAAVNIPADTPLKEEYFEPMRAEELGRRLLPCERAVNCCVNKQYCAGGLIKVGDVVDVQLITAVDGCDGKTTTPADLSISNSARGNVVNTSLDDSSAANAGARNASAIIVRSARVIARRNSLYPVNSPLGPDCCINYTLAMNPYRAGLTEFVKDKGIVALLPLSEAERAQVMLPTGNLIGSTGDQVSPASVSPSSPRKGDGTVSASYDRNVGDPYCVNPLGTCRFSIPGNPEYKDENQRVSDYVNGLYTIGEHDLVRIFHLSCIQAPAPPRPTMVERINGVTYTGDQVFDPSTGRNAGFLAVSGSQGTGGNVSGQNNQSTGGIRLASQNTGVGGTQFASGNATQFRFRPPDAACAGTATGTIARSNCPTCRSCATRR
jgi:Flp pilus assembly protein CpaB